MSKGLEYVPKLVHPAIKWSKHDPLHESVIFDVKLMNIEQYGKKCKKLHENSCVPDSHEQKKSVTDLLVFKKKMH